MKKIICWFCYLTLLLTVSIIDQNTDSLKYKTLRTNNVKVRGALSPVHDDGEYVYIEISPEWLRASSLMTYQINNSTELRNGHHLSFGTFYLERGPGDCLCVKLEIAKASPYFK